MQASHCDNNARCTSGDGAGSSRWRWAFARRRTDAGCPLWRAWWVCVLWLWLPAPLVQAQCGPAQLGAPCPGAEAAVLAAPGPGVAAGNPVHLATGHKFQRELDWQSRRTPGVMMVRFYNSADAMGGVLGPGWRSTYDTRLYQVGGRIQLVQADGSRLDFSPPDADGQCAPAGLWQGRLLATTTGWSWFWPNGRVLRFDAVGRLRALVWPSGQQWLLEWEEGDGLAGARLRAVRTQQGAALLQFEHARTVSGWRLVAVDTPHGRLRYSYDRLGRLVAVSYPDRHGRQYHYEPEAQHGAAHQLTGLSARWPAGGGVRLASWGYGPEGRVHWHERPGQPRQQYRYAPAAGYTEVEENGQSTRVSWDAEGARYALRDVQGPACVGCPAPARTVTPPLSGWPGLAISLDALGQITGWSSAATGTEQWQRTPAEGRVARHFANGDVWELQLSPEGLPLQRIERSAEGARVTTALQWSLGRLTQVQHPIESETRAYDGQGWLAQRTLRRAAQPARGVPGLAYTEAFVHDPQGRLLRHDLPEGGALHYTWSSDGRLAQLVWETRAAVRHVILAQVGQSAGWRYGNGVRVAGWRQHGRLTAWLHLRQGHLLGGEVRHHDARGRLSSERWVSARRQMTLAYAHDQQGRLVATAARQVARSEGERQRVWRHQWLPDGRAVAVGRGAVPTVAPPVWRDASGLPRQAGTRQLDYGPARRLASVREPGQWRVQYLHNAWGQQVVRQSATGVEQWLWQGGRVVADWQARACSEGSAGNEAGVVRRYVYAAGTLVGVIVYGAPQQLHVAGTGDAEVPGTEVLEADPRAAAARPDTSSRPPCALAAETHWLAVHTDLLGVPRLMTDGAGTVVWEGTPDPWAGVDPADPFDARMPWRLPGQRLDPLTGWHDNGARTYDPAAGHYLEPDPLGLWLALAPRQQRRTGPFGYAAQQPRRFVDPSGLLLMAFDGTRENLSTVTNVYHFTLLYQDAGAEAAGTLGFTYEPGPGRVDVLELDAAMAYSADATLSRQWDAMLDELRQRQNEGSPVPIDLIGYSRGAALARIFGNQLVDATRQGRFWTQDGGGVVTACVDLRFVGLFESVARFGVLGSRDTEYDFSVAPDWRRVAHAVSLNEHRTLFSLLSLRDASGQLPIGAQERGFAGAHADIGGGLTGSPTSERDDLSDIALHWMLAQARAAGVTLREPAPAQQQVQDPVLHDYRSRQERGEAVLGELGVVIPGAGPGDRAVQAADGSVLHALQADLPGAGAAERAAVEAFIQRNAGWAQSDERRVGEVDLAAYARWLAQSGAGPCPAC